EVDEWTGQDPTVRLQTWLVAEGHLDEETIEQVKAQAEEQAAALRDRMNAEPVVEPLSLFEHVYAEPTPQLLEQRAMVAAELAGQAASADDAQTAGSADTNAMEESTR